jgi:hypothetical protein
MAQYCSSVEIIMDKVEVVNYKAFGEKVKAWTKGTAPLPSSIEEFASQLAAANVGAKIPERFKHVKFMQSNEDTLVVRLPCKARLHRRSASPGRAVATRFPPSTSRYSKESPRSTICSTFMPSGSATTALPIAAR